jgi:hypothetical protein
MSNKLPSSASILIQLRNLKNHKRPKRIKTPHRLHKMLVLAWTNWLINKNCTCSSNNFNSNNSSSNSSFNINKWWHKWLHSSSKLCKHKWWPCSNNNNNIRQLWCLSSNNNFSNKLRLSQNKKRPGKKKMKKPKLKFPQQINHSKIKEHNFKLRLTCSLPWCTNSSNKNTQIKWVKLTKWVNSIKWILYYISSRWSIICNIGNHLNNFKGTEIKEEIRMIRKMRNQTVLNLPRLVMMKLHSSRNLTLL